MTDEEKKELDKLTKKELIDLLDEYREDAAKQRERERKDIIDKFFHGGRDPEEEKGGGEDPFDLKGNSAFQELKKRYSR